MKFGRVHLVGHSLAGDEMTLFATLHAERVGRLVYLDAAVSRHRIVDLLLSDASAPPLMKRMMLELRGSPAAAAVIVPDMPPADEWEHHKAVYRAMSEFAPDYRKVKAPALSVYAIPSTHPGITPDTPETQRKQMHEWWATTALPYKRANINQFRKQAPRGEIVEMPGADHYLFLGATEEQVVRRTREFLSRGMSQAR